MIDELMIDDTGHDQLTYNSVISQKCKGKCKDSYFNHA